ncbi:ribbon-helix-helix domain-containing protein [Aetokthonos hydrillicola Thurmond2011]|uniref:Ribbon-helix-helix domain-containing protein n=1 Tax=Aetokthonos hydrillicola Thurmond2011 TaxID=2712845 RepID=A0AAP5MEA2_9CYAN|nr:ribbon-helix-helix domain-containing protein [Aetokthonos hydrillicola]MBW4588399.1 ribbon-helix-helix domain-containing protein [Aetokthonos hydrillicola CCALA 1050]MDR9900768.1 ribbon-helix-helix domain-containing protein [Aetokthonos hydrillicola Thurmond2011]
MASKIRKQIYIEPHQEHLLKTIAQQTGVSEAEIIRQAINLHIGNITDPQTNIAAWESELAFINSRKNLTPLPGGRDWQREDLYER